MLLTDAHLHLQDCRLTPYLPTLIGLLREAGVASLWVNSTSPLDWQDVSGLARCYPEVYPFLGVHPWFVNDLSPDWLEDLLVIIEAQKCGIGEIGLDCWKGGLAYDLQEQVFRAQLELAVDLCRPVNIHCLKAWKWLLEVLNDFDLRDIGFIVHSYGGSVDVMRCLLKRGAYISFSANLLKSDRLQEVLKSVPRDRLLLETDAPDMSLPAGYGVDLPILEYSHLAVVAQRENLAGGKRINSPLNIGYIYEFAADVLKLDVQELAACVQNNAAVLWQGGDALT